MTSKSKLPEKLDELFEKLLTEANAGDTPLETKIDIFKEGIRWAAVKNKIPETEEKTPENDRLTRIKRGLGR